MSKRNPLRRLSVALRLTEAYEPSPVSPADTPSISKFLAKQKTNWLNDVKEDPVQAAENWTVVMGNEAGDLDSIASSIAYAWILTEWKNTPAIPLVQVERKDLALRAENLYAFKLAGLSETQEELLTLTEISELNLKPFPASKFALVDHNRLGSSYTVDNPNADVVAVVDHHEDEKLYPTADPRIIGPAGSCASHVATLLPPEPLSEVATLLLTAILIDTDGLKPGGKALQIDRDSGITVATKSTLSNTIPPLSALSPIDSPNPDALYEAQAIKELTAALLDKKLDVSHLSGFDLLRRDYKEYTHALPWASGTPSIKVGLSTVPSPLHAWGSKGQLERDAVKWMTQRGITALGVLTSFNEVKNAAKIANVAKKASGSGKVDKGKHKREQAWIVLEEPELAHLGAGASTVTGGAVQETTPTTVLTIEALSKRLFEGLEADKTLELVAHKKFGNVQGSKELPASAKARVYKQGNAKATRKITAPVVKAVLEGGEVPAGAAVDAETEGGKVETKKGKEKKDKGKEKKKDDEGKKTKVKDEINGEQKEEKDGEDDEKGKKDKLKGKEDKAKQKEEREREKEEKRKAKEEKKRAKEEEKRVKNEEKKGKDKAKKPKDKDTEDKAGDKTAEVEAEGSKAAAPAEPVLETSKN